MRLVQRYTWPAGPQSPANTSALLVKCTTSVQVEMLVTLSVLSWPQDSSSVC